MCLAFIRSLGVCQNGVKFLYWSCDGHCDLSVLSLDSLTFHGSAAVDNLPRGYCFIHWYTLSRNQELCMQLHRIIDSSFDNLRRKDGYRKLRTLFLCIAMDRSIRPRQSSKISGRYRFLNQCIQLLELCIGQIEVLECSEVTGIVFNVFLTIWRQVRVRWLIELREGWKLSKQWAFIFGYLVFGYLVGARIEDYMVVARKSFLLIIREIFQQTNFMHGNPKLIL